MEPQFIINAGGLDKLGFTEKEFLELLDIDLKKAIPTEEEYGFGCPQCKRDNVDNYFSYYEHRGFNFGGNNDYTSNAILYKLCVCGCLYVSRLETKRISGKGDTDI